jgi:hypothetical protein
MAANRFLDWFMGRFKTYDKPKVKRKPRVIKYLLTFEVKEQEFGTTETETIIYKRDIEKFLRVMQEQNYKFTILTIIKL